MRAIICVVVVLAATSLLGRPSEAAPPGSAAKPAEVPKAAAVEPTEVVPGLPDYPGAVMESYEEKGPGDGWTKTWKRETRVTAAYQEVRKFYLEQIEKKGWRVLGMKEKPDEIEWSLARGRSRAEIEVDDSIGVVKIEVARKDR